MFSEGLGPKKLNVRLFPPVIVQLFVEFLISSKCGRNDLSKVKTYFLLRIIESKIIYNQFFFVHFDKNEIESKTVFFGFAHMCNILKIVGVIL